MTQTADGTDGVEQPRTSRVPAGFAVQATVDDIVSDAPHGEAAKIVPDGKRAPMDAAARVLVENLFAQPTYRIPGVDYAVGYKLAEGLTGGDIVDVYLFDNGNTSFSDRRHLRQGVRCRSPCGAHQVRAARLRFGKV